MQIIYGEYPPNYERIAKAFDLTTTKGIVFTYGNKLFIPSGKTPDKQLMRHEETHARQQLEMGIEEWWDKFLIDPSFRFGQELEAYRNQYKAMATLSPTRRANYLDHISKSLAGDMYGNLMTPDEARAYIVEGIVLKQSYQGNNTARKAKKLARQNRRKGRR